MTGWKQPERIEHIPDDQEIWLISDLHLGDGTPSDAFVGKDADLLAFLRAVDRRGVTLVVGGDAMDFHQAWSFARILRAHRAVLGAMSQLAQKNRLFYLVGNHDYDIGLYSDVLQFQVCDRLQIGERIWVTHGCEYDPYHGTLDLNKNQWLTKIHHLTERYLQSWIRIPLGEFYTWPNRITFWSAYNTARLLHAVAWAMRAVGVSRRLTSLARFDRLLNFWTRSNMGDPMCMFHGVWHALHAERFSYLVCGHSHLPGVVHQGARAYVNTGSWTFASSNYAVWDGRAFSVRDWMTGRRFADEFYRPLLEGALDGKDFWQWWRENYMGRLRFREGEERRVAMRHRLAQR